MKSVAPNSEERLRSDCMNLASFMLLPRCVAWRYGVVKRGAEWEKKFKESSSSWTPFLAYCLIGLGCGSFVYMMAKLKAIVNG